MQTRGASPGKFGNRDRGSFAVFQGAFWLVAGFLLFLSGVSQGPTDVSLVRNLYYTLVGCLFTGLAAYGLPHILSGTLPLKGWLAAIAASIGAGSLLTLPINPVTYGQLGVPMHELTLPLWFAGSLNYSLVLMVWALLFRIWAGKPPAEPPSGSTDEDPPTNPMISAYQGSQRVSIPIDDVLYLKAAGDYVQVTTHQGERLKRTTLKAMEDRCASLGFLRIHRSLLINTHKVTLVEALSKGSFNFQFPNGNHLQSSRSYRQAIQHHFFAPVAEQESVSH